MKKVAFICYNYLTLAKSIYYAREKYNDAECKIFYRENTTKLSISHEKFDNITIIIIPYKNVEENSRQKSKLLSSVFFYLKKIKIVRKTKRLVLDFFGNLNSTDELVVFKDNDWIECTLMNSLSQVRITLIEEGLALYTNENVCYNRFKQFKRVISLILGIELSEATSNTAVGFSNKVNQIICTEPEAFRIHRPMYQGTIIKQDDIFSESFSEYFLSKFNFNLIDSTNIKVLLLTQPIVELNYMELDDYLERLKRIIEIASRHGDVLIKPHPREFEKYNFEDNSKVYVCDRISANIPFEVLSSKYKECIIVTFFSSSAFVLRNSCNTVFAYKLLFNDRIMEMGNAALHDFSDILIPNSLEEFETEIRRELNKKQSI